MQFVVDIRNYNVTVNDRPRGKVLHKHDVGLSFACDKIA